MGAAYLAGLAVGCWGSDDEVAAHWQTDRIFEPLRDTERAANAMREWHKALERAKNWAG